MMLHLATTLLPSLAMLVLCNRRHFMVHSVTIALLLSLLLISTPSSDWKGTSTMCPPEFGVHEFSLYWVLKKWSLFAAYFVFFLMSLFPDSKAIGGLFSFGFCLNVLEAVGQAIADADWVVAIPMLLLAPFYPIMCVSVKDGSFTHKESSNVFGIFPMRMYMDARTCLQWYFVALSASHMFGDFYGGKTDGCGSRLYLTSTCIISLISMEINAAFGPAQRSPSRDFLIRGVAVVWGLLIDTFVDQHFWNKLDDALLPAGYNKTLHANSLLRNLLQAGFIVFGLIYLRAFPRVDRKHV